MIHLDRNAEIFFEGRIRIVLEPPPAQLGSVTLEATCDGITITMTGGHMAYTLPNDKKVQLKISYKDAHGNPAAVDGQVQWASSNTEVATVVASADPPDGSQAWVTPVGPAANCQITATADADLGEGTKALVTPMDLTVAAGEAVAGTIEPVGEAVPI